MSLFAPRKHENVPEKSKWLSGQGAGTWFCISKEKVLSAKEYRVRRVSPQGNTDCDSVFVIKAIEVKFDINQTWDITHISHCAIVRVLQNNIVYTMNFNREYINIQ